MNALETLIDSKPCGFLAAADMPELIRLDRLFPVLVRCGCSRFVCAAQDVEQLSRCVVAGGDYVRDVSFPVGSKERAAVWRPEREAPLSLAVWRAENLKKSGLVGQVPDGRRVRATIAPDEGDWSGAFDGSRVTSDADPGL